MKRLAVILISLLTLILASTLITPKAPVIQSAVIRPAVIRPAVVRPPVVRPADVGNFTDEEVAEIFQLLCGMPCPQ